MRAAALEQALDRARPSLAVVALWLAPAAAQADFGFLPGAAGFHVSATSDVEGQPATLAGSHPYSLITEVNFNQIGEYSDGDLKDLELDQPAGLIENPTAINKCSAGAVLDAARIALRSEPLERELPGDQPDRHRHPEVLLRRRRDQDLRGLQPRAAAGLPLPVRLRPLRRAGHDHPARAGNRQRIRPHPAAHEPLPAAQPDRLQDGNLGHALGDLPRHPARQLPERGRPLLRPCQMPDRRPETLAPEPGLPDPADLLRRPALLPRSAPTPGTGRARWRRPRPAPRTKR